MDIGDKINNLVQLYECVHIEHISDYAEIDIWAKTNRVGVVPNEHTYDIKYFSVFNKLKIQGAMHGAIIDEHNTYNFFSIQPEKTEILPSIGWEGGEMIVFHHKDDSVTALDFFN